MTDKERINNLIHYIILKQSMYENDLILAKNAVIKRKNDPVSVLNLFKAQVSYEVYKTISEEIEQILF